MSAGSNDFVTLLERGRRGDQEALAQLARQYESKVRLVARVLLGPALRPYLDSLDLVQSVHRSLLLGLRQERFTVANPENLLALALTMVRRKVARQWRRARRQLRLDQGSGSTNDLAQLLTSLGTTQSDPARLAQFNDQVHHLCEQMDAGERRLLDLRLQGFSTAEMAREMDLTAVALRVRLTRLRQRLRATGVLDDWL
jgi:RNA polymerase sigma-70 factor (ECF subfamily)